MPLINELWIISKDGIPIYHQAVSEALDENLFGGFISAIHIFIKELGEDQIKKLEMGETKIVILSSIDKGWLFVGRADVDIKEKKVQNYLAAVREIFFNKYGTIVEDWNGNIEIFMDLDNYIDLNNPESPEKKEQKEAQKTRGAFL